MIEAFQNPDDRWNSILFPIVFIKKLLKYWKFILIPTLLVTVSVSLVVIFVLGGMWTNFGPIHECLSNRFPDEAKPMKKSHSSRINGQHRIHTETIQPAHSLFICNIDGSLGSFSVILSFMDGTDVIIPRKPIFFFSNNFLWKFLGADASLFLVWAGQLSFQTLGAVLTQCWQNWR